MELRRYRPDDLEEITELFYETVNHVNSRDYSPEQVRVWSGRRDVLRARSDFFLSLDTLVAVQDGVIVGYGNVDKTGYLDHLFVHKDFQRKGIATALCEVLERYGRAAGNSEITVHASVTAKPFFESRGYQVTAQQQVELDGVRFTNFSMKKAL